MTRRSLALASFTLLVTTAPALASPGALARALADQPREVTSDVSAGDLGPTVDVFLVDRTLAWSGPAQGVATDLVLVSPTRRMIIPVDTHRTDTDSDVFGATTVIPARAAPRRYRAASDGFVGAPRFPSKAPLVFVHAYVDYSGDRRYVLVAHDGDKLVAWFAERIYEEGASKRWTKVATVQLAKNAVIHTPPAEVAAPTYSANSAVAVREWDTLDAHHRPVAAFDLVVGETRAPLGSCAAAPPRSAYDKVERTWTAQPLANPPPVEGAILATRRCRAKAGATSYAIERRGANLLLWTRTDDATPGDWLEERIPLE